MPLIPVGTEFDFILSSTAIKHKLAPDTLLKRVNTRFANVARDEFCWRLYHEGRRRDGRRYSYTEIGRLMDKDHSMILMAVRRHQKRLDDAK